MGEGMKKDYLNLMYSIYQRAIVSQARKAALQTVLRFKARCCVCVVMHVHYVRCAMFARCSNPHNTQTRTVLGFAHNRQV